MEKKISSSRYGLPSRTVLVNMGSKHIGIVKDRKSRIIMKDGLQIEEQARIILSKDSGLTISLLTNAPVCSKTKKFLFDRGIRIYPLT